MASTSDIRKGLTIRWSHGIWTITEFQHVKPGKGNAFVRTKLKNLESGKVLDNTFPAGHKIDVVRVERKTYQYLYTDGELFHFMDTETYEQFGLTEAKIPNAKFLLDGAMVEILMEVGTDLILSVDLPQYIEAEITYTEPGIKGDTATNTLKPATISTGAEIRVPLFIDIGDKVRIATEDGSYMDRVKG